MYIKNALTGKIMELKDSDDNSYKAKIGTKDEKYFYKVMPLDGPEKIFFHDKNEYDEWLKNKINTDTRYKEGIYTITLS